MATQFTNDVVGPDQIRVTIGVEPAVDKYVRGRDRWMIPDHSLLPRSLRMWNVVPQLVQIGVFSGAWAVSVEADSGERLRLTRSDRDGALRQAHAVAMAVKANGVAALAEFRPPRRKAK